MKIGECNSCGRTSTYINDIGKCPRCFNESDDEPKEIYLKCQCGSEILLIEYDPEIESYYVCTYRIFHKWSWLNKLRHIWHILRYETPYTDSMVLDKKSANRIANYINKQ